MAVTSRPAQRSILGPDVWQIEMPGEVCLVGSADDVTVLLVARTVDLAQFKLNRVMRKICSWMAAHGLSSVLSKTEIVVLTKKRIPTILPFPIGDVTVETKPVARYLDAQIGSKLNFLERIRPIANKAEKGVTALSRSMSSVSVPKSSKRRLLMTAIQSVLLYGAKVWANALDKKMYLKLLSHVQKQGMVRVVSAFLTVPQPAVLVITGVIPIDLLAKERRAA